MIKKNIGDLLSVTKGHIVHGCNAEGVMGAGVALAIKNKYMGCYDAYRNHFEDFGLKVGEVIPYIVNDDLIIWNAITQESYGSFGRHVSYDGVEETLAQIEYGMKIFQHMPAVLNFPMIGSGLGGGKWPIIEAIIDNTITAEKVLWVLE